MKTILFPLIILFITFNSFLYPEKFSDLNQEEKIIRKERLKKFNRETFVNRSNERADEETKKADYEAGKKLSQNLLSGIKDASARGIIIRRIVAPEEGRYGGDVFEFTDTVYFGHVNTIVRILTGYIKETYGYSQEDSELLALYSVYFNLKHRQDESYLIGSFSEKVITNTSKEKIGLDENFEEWKGKTQFIVPIEKNILTKGGFDIATFELEDQVNTELDFQKDAGETKKKYSNLQNKKIKIEKEESQKRLISSKTKESEILQRNKKIEERLKELQNDPEANKEELARLQSEKQGYEDEISKIEEEKKQFEKKTVQVNQREEMRKIGITSEKEYKEAVKNKKLPEIYIDPVTSEVKSKGTMSTEYAAMKEKNTPREPYTGSANSVGIPSTKNRYNTVDRDTEKNSQESTSGAPGRGSGEQGVDGRQQSAGQISQDGKSSGKVSSTTGKNSNNGNNLIPEYNVAGDVSSSSTTGGTGSISSKTQDGRPITGIGTERINGSNDDKKDQGSKVSLKISDAGGGVNIPGGDTRNGSGGSGFVNGNGDGKNSSTNSNSGTTGNSGRASGSSNSGNITGGNQVSSVQKGSGNPLQDALNNQLSALSNKNKNSSTTQGGGNSSQDSSGISGSTVNKPVLKIGDDTRKKVAIKVVNEYNLAFHASRLNITAREFIRAPGSGYIVIGRKVPIKSEDLGLFLLDVEELDLRGNANGIVLHKNSPLLYYYDKIIVYEKYNNAVYLTQLDMNLKIDFRSPQPIDPDTSITIEGDTISLMRYNSRENVFQSMLYKLSDFSPVQD